MNPQELCTKLDGVIGFPVTPFNDDHSLDIDGHRKNVRYMLEQPMCALVAAGGTGELYSLTPDEVRQVGEATIEEAAGRAPVIAGGGFAGGLARQPTAALPACWLSHRITQTRRWTGSLTTTQASPRRAAWAC